MADSSAPQQVQVQPLSSVPTTAISSSLPSISTTSQILAALTSQQVGQGANTTNKPSTINQSAASQSDTKLNIADSGATTGQRVLASNVNISSVGLAAVPKKPQPPLVTAVTQATVSHHLHHHSQQVQGQKQQVNQQTQQAQQHQPQPPVPRGKPKAFMDLMSLENSPTLTISTRTAHIHHHQQQQQQVSAPPSSSSSSLRDLTTTAALVVSASSSSSLAATAVSSGTGPTAGSTSQAPGVTGGGGGKKHSSKKAPSSKSQGSNKVKKASGGTSNNTTTTTGLAASSSCSIASSGAAAAEGPPTRSSQRNVKRPRTYDEEVAELEMIARNLKRAKATQKTPKSIFQPKRSGKPKVSAKDLGRWRPTDDLMLISAVQQTNDLMAVYLGVKFSCRFTLKEITERWYAILNDTRISKIAVEAMKSLHPGVITMALNNALWSQEEEAVLAKIPSTDPGHLEKFQKLLLEHPCVFHACRSPTSLHHHWVLMGHYCLLDNQKVEEIPHVESVTKLADAEDYCNDMELMKPRDVKEEALEQELMALDRSSKQEILNLEQELPKWRSLLDTGPPELDSSILATLKGGVVEFIMTSPSVIIGRNSALNKVDFDLSLEGPAFKISRRQATITLTGDGEFELSNEGRRPMYVDGKVLLSGKTTKLQHNQVIEVASLSFLVILNSKLAQAVVAAGGSSSRTVS